MPSAYGVHLDARYPFGIRGRFAFLAQRTVSHEGRIEHGEIGRNRERSAAGASERKKALSKKQAGGRADAC